MIIVYQADAAYTKQGNAEELEGGWSWGQARRVGWTFNGRYVTKGQDIRKLMPLTPYIVFSLSVSTDRDLLSWKRFQIVEL